MELSVIKEPNLEFRHNQRLADPHSGLTLFGPYDADLVSHPGKVAFGVVGTKEGIDSVLKFARLLSKPVISNQIATVNGRAKEQFLWPAFPGYEAAFVCNWAPDPIWTYELDSAILGSLVREADPFKRAYELVDYFLSGIRRASERDDFTPVILCVLPDEIWEFCRPKSFVPNAQGVKPTSREVGTRRKQPDLFNTYKPEYYSMSVDFRRQLKARSMQFGIPIQIVRESTLSLNDSEDPRSKRRLTFLSDRAWNLSSALYYKAGGKPWRLSAARDGVCYIGIAFRRTEFEEHVKTACCAAQMFLDTGDGVVFRGEFGPWYSPEKRECHLSESAATELLKGVIEAYREQGGKDLKEIFLHSRSWIDREEFGGYQKACPSGVKLTAVRVRPETHGLRLYRPGKWPVIRGTVIKISEKVGYLWASGFKANLNTYDGWDVPVPVRIDILHGDADLNQVATDILGLTKLNYNACRLGDASPVTIGFSDVVGEILVSNPDVKVRKPAFKFYI